MSHYELRSQVYITALCSTLAIKLLGEQLDMCRARGGVFVCVSDYVVDPEAKVWRQRAVSTMFKRLLYPLSLSLPLKTVTPFPIQLPPISLRVCIMVPLKRPVRASRGKYLMLSNL